MLELASNVIEANREVHNALTDLLMERNELAYDDVLPILSRVKRIPGAPVPTWSAATVTHALMRHP